MAKKVFAVYLAKRTFKQRSLRNAGTARLPVGAVGRDGKVRLKDGEALYMEIDDYYAFEYLAPHLEELISVSTSSTTLPQGLRRWMRYRGSPLRTVLHGGAEKVNTNGGIITMQDMRDLAVSAKTDCYHVVDAADDAALGRFYAENDFIPELDGVSNEVFEMLDFAGIGRMMRCSENGVL